MQPWETFRTPWSAKDRGVAVGEDPIQGTVVPEFDSQTASGMAESYARSKLSSDVAMPTIAKCRDCHGGSKPAEGKVTSNCLLCHGFHDSTHPWDPGFKPRATKTAATP